MRTFISQNISIRSILRNTRSETIGDTKSSYTYIKYMYVLPRIYYYRTRVSSNKGHHGAGDKALTSLEDIFHPFFVRV